MKVGVRHEHSASKTRAHVAVHLCACLLNFQAKQTFFSHCTMLKEDRGGLVRKGIYYYQVWCVPYFFFLLLVLLFILRLLQLLPGECVAVLG